MPGQQQHVVRYDTSSQINEIEKKEINRRRGRRGQRRKSRHGALGGEDISVISSFKLRGPVAAEHSLTLSGVTPGWLSELIMFPGPVTLSVDAGRVSRYQMSLKQSRGLT